MSPNEFEKPEERERPIDDQEALPPESTELPREEPPEPAVEPQEEAGEELHAEAAQANDYATRAGLAPSVGMDRNKLILLGGGLLAAVLFFVFTAVVGHSPVRKATIALQHSTGTPATRPRGSITPLMDTVSTPHPDSASGEITASDIERTRSSEENPTGPGAKPSPSTQSASNSLGSVPSFADTQQRWEEPRPYGSASDSSASAPQRSSIKESSLVFVASTQPERQNTPVNRQPVTDDNPVLELAPGTRILAKIKMLASTATAGQIVAEVPYTYELGDQVVIPAGALAYGHIEQADRSGYVSVKFDELEVLHGGREKIDAIGTNLNLGPIKGVVYGKNTGRNFLVRAASGLGSVAAMLVGNDTSGAFSEDDLLRQRIAENIGQAGDTEVMNMALTDRVFVSIPAETMIYIIFTRHEQAPVTLRRVSSGAQ